MNTSSRSRPAPNERHLARIGARLGETSAALTALALAIALWWLGGWCTLFAFRQLGIPVHTLGPWQWAIPAGASVVELLWWPRAEQAVYKHISFTLISALDLLSTLHGTITWARGRALPLAMAITVPLDGAAVIIPAGLISVVLTFVPERLARWALVELYTLWMEPHHDR